MDKNEHASTAKGKIYNNAKLIVKAHQMIVFQQCFKTT